MTEQEEIKSGLKKLKMTDWSYGQGNMPHFLSPMDIQTILTYLNSQGVVIKHPAAILTWEVKPLIDEEKDG